MHPDENGTPIIVHCRKCPQVTSDEDASEDGVEREKKVGSESARHQVAGSPSRQNNEPGQGSGEEELQDLEDNRKVAHCQVAGKAQLVRQKKAPQPAKVILKLSALSWSNVAPQAVRDASQSSVTVDNM